MKLAHVDDDYGASSDYNSIKESSSNKDESMKLTQDVIDKIQEQ